MTKKGTVIYGINGMMERNIVIATGQSRIVVQFKNGSYSGYGVAPAEYATDSPFIQSIIEDSVYFRDREIFIIHDYREEVGDPTSVSTTEDTDSPTTNDRESNSDELTRIDMPSLDDAKLYLIEHFSVTPSAVKTKPKIVAIAKANGIIFAGPDFD